MDSCPQSFAATSDAGVNTDHVLIEHGGNDIRLPVTGHPVARVQRAVAQVLNVPPTAAPFINGSEVDGKRLLRNGDQLSFIIKHGSKGGLSPEELQKWNLPEEVTAKRAAEILDCDKKTIFKYIRHGLLEWRDIAPPDSSRPNFRITLESVLNLRRSYRTSYPQPDGDRPTQPQRRTTVADVMRSPHINLNRR